MDTDVHRIIDRRRNCEGGGGGGLYQEPSRNSTGSMEHGAREVDQLQEHSRVITPLVKSGAYGVLLMHLIRLHQAAAC